MFTMSGVTVCEGVSEGHAVVIENNTSYQEVDIDRELSVSEEIVRYRKASRDFASKLNSAMLGTVPDKVRDLFGAVASYITNKANIDAIEHLIREGFTAPEAAYRILLNKINRFSQDSMDEQDQEMVQIASELGTLMREFINTIDNYNMKNESVVQITSPSVIVANDLTPASFLSLHTELVRAVILENGEASSHLSTVLRDLRIPAIYGVKGALTIKNGEHILVDATRGTILVEPPQDTARALIAQSERFNYDDDISDADLKVTVAGSMGAVGDLGRMASYLNHGLGLLRSEFLFLNYRQEPTCEQMTKSFSHIFSRIPKTAPLTARTFDFAGDKKPLFTIETDESGPLRKYGANVGSRLLKNELKALLLASANREIYIVFPLITRISEAKALNDLLDVVKAELEASNIPYGQARVALMIETPAAVLSARGFATLGDMFLIGTSSLAEYAAAPRPPEEYFTPALSKMIAIACKAAHDEGVKVGIAGRFAQRIELLPLFLSLGVSYITTDSSAINKVRNTLQQLQDKGLEPHFDYELYLDLMDTVSAADLQNLIFSEDSFY